METNVLENRVVMEMNQANRCTMPCCTGWARPQYVNGRLIVTDICDDCFQHMVGHSANENHRM